MAAFRFNPEIYVDSSNSPLTYRRCTMIKGMGKTILVYQSPTRGSILTIRVREFTSSTMRYFNLVGRNNEMTWWLTMPDWDDRISQIRIRPTSAIEKVQHKSLPQPLYPWFEMLRSHTTKGFNQKWSKDFNTFSNNSSRFYLLTCL